MLKIYTYAKCSTCRDARKWLEARGLPFGEHPIRETPPTADELKIMLKACGGQMKRLFNTSSQDYRDLGISQRMDSLPPSEAFALIARNGNLARRPFLLGPGLALVGFDERAWEEAFRKAGR